jgi:hypothetical protein
MTGTAVFLDTSIQISRFFKADDLKLRIRQRLSAFDLTVTGLVVRNEFRRRIFAEAQYLLNLLHKYNSAKRVQQHVNDQLGGSYNQRKRNICLDLLTTFYATTDDRDHTSRLKSLLRSLLICGLDDFDESVDAIMTESGCACGKQRVKEVDAYKKYEIGSSSCAELKERCHIRSFLLSKETLLQNLQIFLTTIPAGEKSQEILRIEDALKDMANPSASVEDMELCKKVGDLLICLESDGIPSMYTQNVAESKHLCRALEQTLIYRSNHPSQEDSIINSGD